MTLRRPRKPWRRNPDIRVQQEKIDKARSEHIDAVLRKLRGKK